jgi:nitroreductase
MSEHWRHDGRSPATSKPSDQVNNELLRAAIAAPSLHNARPWRLRVKNTGTTIEIFADP